MHQIILATALLFSSFAFASTSEITSIYNQFSKQKEQLLKSELNKKNIAIKVEASYKALEKALEELKAIESKVPDSELTPEGNQMAYDLEILEPLKTLASSLISKEDCIKAKHEHALNFPIVEDDDAHSIQNILNKVCGQ